MYLKRLEMQGFKSFVDANLVFQPGITAVVGPNGTGKSNILDAILWVLGEQSTKTLRSEKMEDVIFNGTEARKPLGMVEVSLVLGGVSGGPGRGEGEPAALPYALGDYQEVMVTRRLFRDGVSEYFINKTPCRLKDLRGLLLDTRAGSKGHTIIEQGMIDRLLKASPVERRELIEETAGIVRYKKQKGEALRKLEATNQNLVRVRDVVNEVRRQLATLERQARAAEVYQTLRKEVRQLELRVLVHDYRTMLADREEADRMLGDLTVRESAESAAVARLAAEVETIQVSATEGERLATGLRDQVVQAEGRLAQAGADIKLCAQRATMLGEQRVRVQADLEHVREEQRVSGEGLAELRGRLVRLAQELTARSAVATDTELALDHAVRRYREDQEALEAARAAVMDRAVAVAAVANRLAHDQSRAAELVRRAERVETEREQASAAFDSVTALLSTCIDKRRQTDTDLAEAQRARTELEDRVARLRDELVETEKHVGRLQEEFAVSTARHKVLQSISGDAGVSVLDQGPDRALLVHETLAQALSVPAEYECAIEAVLGHLLTGILVDSPAEALQLLGARAVQGAAGGTFIPTRPRRFGARAQVPVEGLGVIGPALNLVSPQAGRDALVVHLLADVVVVDTLEHAVELWEGMTADRQALLVTLRGEVLAPDGIVSGSPVGTAVGVISRERELRTLTTRVQELERELQAAQTQRQTRDAILREEAVRLESLEADVRRLELALTGERKDEQKGEQDFSHWRQRVEALIAERDEARGECQALAVAEQEVREELQRLEAERSAAEAALAACQERGAVNASGVEQQQAAATHVRVEVAGLRDRFDQATAEAARMDEALALRAVRIRELEGEVARLQEAGVAAVAERTQTEERVPLLEAELDAARRRLVEAQEAQAARVTKLRSLEADWNRVRHGLEELHRQQEAVRLKRVETQTRLEGYDAQLTGTYAVNYEGAISELGDLEEDGPGEIEAVRERLSQRRGKLQDLGPVNVMAIDEHRELEERLRFLTTQEEDLTQSIASLRAIIAKINKTTKQLFLDTFQELQTKFNDVFRNFFEGGRAELVLVEDEESAEPGVDIVAQPPGKRLKNIAMLSGGERALTAMSLIFASFLIRPTPFCVLDEIDAPLDEENTLRFTRVLRNLSEHCQFIVITHSKQTMEMADSLYGVTMEEAGISSLISVRMNKLLEHA